MSVQGTRRKVTLTTLQKMKDNGERFAMMTAYDYCQSVTANKSGVEIMLVGDSLGMVIQGHDSSLPVTVDDIAYHVRCVRRGNSQSMIMADMPFMSYFNEVTTLENAATLMRDGAHMVKLEGAGWLGKSTKLLARHGIPVCAHMGLTPQSVNHLGGYRVQGRDPEQAEKIIAEAKQLEDDGASIILLECVPVDLGKAVTEALKIPVIGIGAGPHTDAQVLVWHDLLGFYPGKPAKFVKNFLEGNPKGIEGAVSDYVNAVKDGSFPAEEHCYF